LLGEILESVAGLQEAPVCNLVHLEVHLTALPLGASVAIHLDDFL
jgi:hypothetical protein